LNLPKKKNRKRKRKRRDDLENLFFCNNWKFRRSSVKLYDKVVIDAQCTLDASIRHILQYNKVGWKDFDPRIDKKIVYLQKRLIINGFRLLKEGGTLVYSTCSFCKSQNEEVIQWLLVQEPQAQVIPIKFANEMPAAQSELTHTLRFYPAQTGTSGMFIAKVYKMSEKKLNV